MKNRDLIGVSCAVLALFIFGALRYENFLSAYNLLEFGRYNTMFALISIGMAFVIMTGGIDLSVGTVAALGSVVSALLSPWHAGGAILAGVVAGSLCGAVNGWVITRLKIQPFIATLAMTLAAHGLALLLANNQAIAPSYASGFADFGQGDLAGIPLPLWVLAVIAAAAGIAHTRTPFGRHCLAIGGSEEAAKLMGLHVDRNLLGVYVLSGTLAGLAGVFLAAQGSGQPNEGMGWDLFAISAVVVGGTLLSGGVGSIAATLVGVLLLGLVFNLLNFENGLGQLNLSSYWQSVIRGSFLFLVVVIQAQFLKSRRNKH